MTPKLSANVAARWPEPYRSWFTDYGEGLGFRCKTLQDLKLENSEDSPSPADVRRSPGATGPEFESGLSKAYPE